MESLYDLTADNLNGEPVSLEEFRGQVLLIVNTASRCGFTPQYRALEALYQAYKDRGFSVLAFPCNQFGAQEPAPNAEIGQFCQTTYGVSFPVFGKIDVNGPNCHPLYRYLKKQAPGWLGSQAIKWNFCKFLLDRDGRVVGRYAPITPPERIQCDIELLLSA